MDKTFTLKTFDQISAPEPSRQTIQNILNYSKALNVQKMKNGENFEMIMN